MTEFEELILEELKDFEKTICKKVIKTLYFIAQNVLLKMVYIAI